MELLLPWEVTPAIAPLSYSCNTSHCVLHSWPEKTHEHGGKGIGTERERWHYVMTKWNAANVRLCGVFLALGSMLLPGFNMATVLVLNAADIPPCSLKLLWSVLGTIPPVLFALHSLWFGTGHCLASHKMGAHCKSTNLIFANKPFSPPDL